MQIAAHILAYNVNRFLKSVIENIEPHVDKIYIAHAEKPFGYIEDSRLHKTNPTKVTDMLTYCNSSKIEIVQGDWFTEEEMRNDCLEKARADGFDWFIIQDADEFYTDLSWEQIRIKLNGNKSDNHFITTWYNFWKSSQNVIVYPNGSIKDTNAGFAIRCKSDLKFIKKRICNNQTSRIIDFPCYHYGYVMSDDEMEEKLLTWSHAKEVNTKSWFNYKWKNWDYHTLNLHPTYPTAWLRAVRFPLEQPFFAEQFSLDIEPSKKNNLHDNFGDSMYNFKANLVHSVRNLKKIIG